MSTVRRLLSFALLALPLLLVQSCEENVTGPGAGSGTLLEATVDGVKLSIPLASIAPFAPVYEVASQRVSFGGTLVGTPSKSVAVYFSFDLDTASIPANGTTVNLNYIVLSGSTAETYECDQAGNNCVVTVTARNGDIIDGTFQGELVNRDDTTKKITISDGRFSVKLTRQ